MSTSLRRAQPPPGLRPLLSSFPAPPSHIPASPAVSSPAIRSPLSPFPGNELVNPPLSGPPMSPLPPVPEGPSKVTEAEQIAFIAMRRASYASSSRSSRSHAHSRQSSNSNSEEESAASSAVAVSPSVSAVFVTSNRSVGSARSSHGSNNSSTDGRAQDRATTPSPRTSASTLAPQPTRTRSLPVGGDESILLERPEFNAAADGDGHDRASSPDIAALIQRAHTHTPRSSTPAGHPARRSRSSHSNGRRSTPGIKRLRSTPALGSTVGFYPSTRPDAPPFPQFGEEDDVDADADTWEGASADADPDAWDEVWEEPELEDSEEDVIDLRTPLPHLMLRAGLLSPHSKLLPRPSPSPEPVPPLPQQKAILNKRAPPRDERDTVKRRERHKDGKLLRGGIGLTTGLGWSDSEDEDAPSALTHRLSRLAPTLSRKSSMASSLASSTSSTPFGRSPSRSTTLSLSTKSTTVSRSGSTASTPISRSPSTASVAPTLSRSTSSNTISREAQQPQQSSVLPYLAKDDAHGQELEVPTYPYVFEPPTPTDVGHSHASMLTPLVTGPAVWRPPRSPLFDDIDPFARQYQYHAPHEDRSPTPTNGTSSSGSGSTMSLSTPVREEPHLRPHRVARPPSKALPPLPTDRTSNIPKTASMSSLRSLAGTQGQQVRVPSSASFAGLRLRERATSNASVQSTASARSAASTASAASVVRTRPSLPNAKASAIRPRTSSTSSAGSVRPLKPAIKPASIRSGMVMPRSRFASSVGPEAPTGIAI